MGGEGNYRMVTCMALSRAGLLVSLILLLWGCPTGPQMSQVDVGMSRDQVLGIMGRPDGDRVVGTSEAMTYSNRLMSGWGWDRADYHVVLTEGRVVAYGPGVVGQNSGPNVLVIVPVR
jgi:hypothetical protein